MPEQTTAVTGANLHGWQRTISGLTTPVDEFVIPGEYPYPSYFVSAENVAVATANDHVLQIMAAASTYLRIRSIRIEQRTNGAAASTQTFQILRLTTAGTGGTAITPRPFDPADTAASTAMTLPTVKGTEGVLLMPGTMSMRATANPGTAEDQFYWWQMPNTKPIIIPAGTANGIVIKITSAVASATWNVVVELVETSFNN